MARRDRIRRVETDAPRLKHPVVSLVWWLVFSAFFVSLWDGDGFFWPVFPIAGWGLAILARWLNRPGSQHPTAPGIDLPVRDAVPPLVPVELLQTAEQVDQVARELRALGRGPLAESLEVGLRGAIRLVRLRTDLGDIDAGESEARAEVERLETKSAAATDPEARGTWEEAAAVARRRLEKLGELRATDDRVHARIESFQQLVKSLRVDVTRAALGDGSEGTLAELTAEARGVDREIEALQRTDDELRRLGARPLRA